MNLNAKIKNLEDVKNVAKTLFPCIVTVDKETGGYGKRDNGTREIKLVVGWKKSPLYDPNANPDQPDLTPEQVVLEKKKLEPKMPDIRIITVQPGITAKALIEDHLMKIKKSLETKEPVLDKEITAIKQAPAVVLPSDFELAKQLEKGESAAIGDEGWTDEQVNPTEWEDEPQAKEESVEEAPNEVLDAIISAKQNALGPLEGFSAGMDPPGDETLSKVYETYQRILDIQGLYDYEDLIYKVVCLFETDEESCKIYQKAFKHIFIDEYQDLNPIQYRLVRLLSPIDDKQREICVIGDPNQSIYGFRGSDSKFFKRFITDFPDAEVITLNRNYRSSESIIQASNQVINIGDTENFGTRIYSEIKGLDTLSIIETTTEKAEAVAIGKKIENLIGGMGFYSIDFNKTVEDSQKSRGFSDFAILYRTKEQSKVFEDIFKEAGVPYQIACKEGSFNQKGIQEIISMLKIIERVGSYADMERISGLKNSRIDVKTIKALASWGYKNNHNINDAMSQARRFPIPGMNRNAQRAFNEFVSNIMGLGNVMQTMSVKEKISYLYSHPLLHEEANSINEEVFKDILSLSKAFGSNSFDFVSAIQLKTDEDIYNPQAERVSLMTMHAAKGLEFKVVFIAGCENGFLPFHNYGNRQADVEEERRLFYVSITRAKEQLFITHAKKRRIYGQLKHREISPFISDIEERLRKHEKNISIKRQKKDQIQLSLF